VYTLTHFLSKQAGVVSNKLNHVCIKSMYSHSEHNKEEWHKDIEQIEQLYKEQKYKKALKAVSVMESKYVGCSKIMQNYQGKIGIALLKQNGELKDLKPSI
jgi:hypothetical protein